jgi:hypothetical protein
VYVGNPILSVFSLSESLLISNSEYVFDNSGIVLLKKVVEKFGIPQFIQFHERLLLSSIFIKENKEAPDKSWSVTRYIQVKHLHNIHDGADKKDKNYQI